jgi:hypothetical protein
MEIDKVVPVAASVKTKLGRGGTGEERSDWKEAAGIMGFTFQ